MLNNLLFYRFIIFNASAVAAFVWAVMQGYVQTVVLGDTSRISFLIIAVFVLGMISVLKRAGRVSLSLNALKRGDTIKDTREKFLAKAEHIDDMLNWLVTLGLLGTIIGFIVAFSGIDPDALATASGVQKMIGAMMPGIGIALYTTLVGATCGLWLDVNRRMLRTATILMFEDAENDAKRPMLGASVIEPAE